MKKLLIYVINLLVVAWQKLHSSFLHLKDRIYTKFHKPPLVESVDNTIEYIIKNKCSVSRYGDGEIKIVNGRDISFQKADKLAVSMLREVLSSDVEGHIVCLADIFGDRSRYLEKYTDYWKGHLDRYRKVWYKYIIKGKTYYNASFTRQYISLNDKSESQRIFERIIKIWDGRDIVIIEGEMTGLGVGNYLFSNTKSVKRILCPAKNAFDKYYEIINALKEVATDSNTLVLIALGPCATALAYDIHKEGYQAVDIGHVDIEYEWFRRKSKEKIAIEGKFVNEAGASLPKQICDKQYLSEIVKKVI